MNEAHIRQASNAFGFDKPDTEQLTSGLIHNTYKVSDNTAAIVLQHINLAVFNEPEKIIRNYLAVYNYLQANSDLRIPEPIPCASGNYLFTDEDGNIWRATQFITDSYIESSSITSGQARKAAECFGAFSQTLSGLGAATLEVVIPGFHDLAWRYEQFTQALRSADSKRLDNAKQLIEGVQQRTRLVYFYTSLKDNSEFRLRIMHHDCKISNILFDKRTRNPICPIDLDTIMPGYFFSDIGDLIRSVTGTVGEAATNLESLKIKESYYTDIVSGYFSGLGNQLTSAEKKVIHHAGLIMIYMQCIRFLTDYLNGDTYYKVAYPEQNMDRSKNQFQLLVKLEELLTGKFNYQLPY
ncbi:aminoglycoside phosphotransferase family protein [Oscillatoria amoena NRMC-F 0135]|nr:aminoglycoside phosphotransferase family protein [Oscillatoria amoena NRMC-F 0135]